MFSMIFPPENRNVYEIMWKNMVEPERSQTTTDNYGYRHILRICNTYCFSTARMVSERASI